MLVLSRKKNQSIVINDEVEVTVMEINADSIKIGINAPKNVIIHRKEVYDKIKKEMKDAAKSPLPKMSHLRDDLREDLSDDKREEE